MKLFLGKKKTFKLNIENKVVFSLRYNCLQQFTQGQVNNFFFYTEITNLTLD